MSTPRLPRLAQVNLKAHYKYHSVEVAEDVRTSALKMGLKVSGAIPLPTTIEKWSFLKSPFVHKKAWTQWERRTYNRIIEIYGEGTQSHDATKTVQFLRYLEHTILPANLGTNRLKVTLYSEECLEPRSTIVEAIRSAPPAIEASAAVPSEDGEASAKSTGD
mmetsp:Transcript_1442/g.2970  ORF Transcript_1442/g.2970 Transcript_1442/m.2970 type:complete len:162 (-) Transcript_1442:430-915(-)